MTGTHTLYLDLMERCLLGTIYQDVAVDPWNEGKFKPENRLEGRDWPSSAHTMIGVKRMRNLRECCETVLRDHIPGDFIETGIWRGGACILMRAILQAYGDSSRRVWCADSFEGLPPPDPRYPQDSGDPHHEHEALAISLEQVQENFRRYGLLDDRVKFLKGWFKDTLPGAPIDQLAILRLDGDMYQSTIEALDALYPKLASGGFCIVDDLGAVPGCFQAVEDYRNAHGIRDQVSGIDWTGAFWRKS